MHKRPIMVIEDNDADIRLFTQAFENAGIVNPLLFMKTGGEALEYLAPATRKSPFEARMPCLILLNLSLPDQPGIDVLREIRGSKATRCIPTIVMSGSEQEEDIIQSYRLGANSFIRKIEPAQKFHENIHYLCMYWLNVARLPVA